MTRAFKIVHKTTPEHELGVPLPLFLYAAAYTGLIGSLPYLIAPLAVA